MACNLMEFCIHCYNNRTRVSRGRKPVLVTGILPLKADSKPEEVVLDDLLPFGGNLPTRIKFPINLPKLTNLEATVEDATDPVTPVDFSVVVVVVAVVVVVVCLVVVVALGVVMGILTSKSSRTTSSGLLSALGGGIPVTKMGFLPLLTPSSPDEEVVVVEVTAGDEAAAEEVEAVVLGVSGSTSSRMGLFHRSPAPAWRNHGGRGRLVVVAATRGAQA